MSERNSPFSQFNFMVEWDGLDGNTICAGFQEVSGIGMDITVAGFQEGGDNSCELLKVSGAVKTTDVILKRGLIGASELYEWFDYVRKDTQDQLKNVTITLLSEDRKDVMKWLLINARPMKYAGPSLNGKGTYLAIEELVLTPEGIKLEAKT